MKHIASVVLVLVASGVAQAAPFEVLSIEVGGQGGLGGSGFTVSTGTFFNAQPVVHYDGAIAPADSYTAANFYEFDSHFTIDGFGPSARNRTTNPGDNSIATMLAYGGYGPPGGPAANYDVGEFNPGGFYVYGPGGHIGDEANNPTITPPNQARGIGVGFAPPAVHSGPAPDGLGGRLAGSNYVFLGRLTVSFGASISGSLLLNVVDPSSGSGFSFGVLTLGGAPVLIGTSSGPQLFSLSANLLNAGVLARGSPFNITVPTSVNPPLGEDDEPLPFGPADVYDLWATIVPAPGAATATAFLAFAAARRRR